MSAHPCEEQRMLERFMWISIAASLFVIALKAYAAYVTGSVGFLSDALESVANVAAAMVGLWALKLSAKPADENHNFGHAKAEYFAAQVEGSLILVASVAIIYTAGQRLITPQPVEQLGIGLLFSVVATLINLGVGAMLVRAGRRRHRRHGPGVDDWMAGTRPDCGHPGWCQHPLHRLQASARGHPGSAF